MPNKYSHFGSISFHFLAQAHTHTKSSFNSFTLVRLSTLFRIIHKHSETEQSELDNGNMYSLSLWFLILLPFWHYCVSLVLLFAVLFVYSFVPGCCTIIILMWIVWRQNEHTPKHNVKHPNKNFAATLAIKNQPSTEYSKYELWKFRPQHKIFTQTNWFVLRHLSTDSLERNRERQKATKCVTHTHTQHSQVTVTKMYWHGEKWFRVNARKFLSREIAFSLNW